MESKQESAKSPYQVMEDRFKMLFHEYWTQGNEEVLPQIIDEGCSIVDFTTQSDYQKLDRGPEGMKQLAKKLRTAFSDLKADVQMVLNGAGDEGNRVACFVTFQGHHSGPLEIVLNNEGKRECIKPTGDKVYISSVNMTNWNEQGKMTEFKLSCDMLALIRNCGWESNMNRRLVQEFYNEILNGCVTNRERLSQYLWPDCEINDPATPFLPSTTTGVEAFEQCISMYHQAFHNLHYEIKDIFCGGNKVIVHWHATGVQYGRFLEREPNRQCFSTDGISTWTFISGKIKKVINHWDLTTLYKQLGQLNRPE